MSAYPTPHIDATPDDFGKTVLMPGDPLRSKFIAEHFLENPKLVNNVRGVCGYTGTYKNTKISVMASGMGMPSIGIYSYELFNFFDVENIIRVGSAGGMSTDVKVRDIVIGMGASTTSAFANQYRIPGTIAPIASYPLMKKAIDVCERMGLRYHVGNLLSSDTFYCDNSEQSAAFMKMGVLATEMEAAALYLTAARAGKNALAICTISDHLITGEETTAAERETTFTDMMKVALDAAVEMEK